MRNKCDPFLNYFYKYLTLAYSLSQQYVLIHYFNCMYILCFIILIATAISQWCTAIPLLYYLNKSTKFLDYYSTSNTAFHNENNDKLSVSNSSSISSDIDQSSSMSNKLTEEETIQLKTKKTKTSNRYAS